MFRAVKCLLVTPTLNQKQRLIVHQIPLLVSWSVVLVLCVYLSVYFRNSLFLFVSLFQKLSLFFFLFLCLVCLVFSLYISHCVLPVEVVWDFFFDIFLNIMIGFTKCCGITVFFVKYFCSVCRSYMKLFKNIFLVSYYCIWFVYEMQYILCYKNGFHCFDVFML